MHNEKIAELLSEQANLKEKLKRLTVMQGITDDNQPRCCGVAFQTDYGAHTHLNGDMAIKLTQYAIELVAAKLDTVNAILTDCESVLAKAISSLDLDMEV